MSRRFVLGALIVLLGISGRIVTPTAWSQDELGTEGEQLSELEQRLGPASQASLQILAEARYIRAYGELQKDLAAARILAEAARAMKQVNDVNEVRNKILIRDIIKEDVYKRIGNGFRDVRQRHDRVLERLKNHPEMNAGDIVTGGALNFLKNRLAPKIATFRSATSSNSQAYLDVAAKLRVTPAIVHSLQVRQDLPRGESFVFRLDEGQGLQVTWWPPALRVTDLKEYRKKFEAARAAALNATSEDEFETGIRKLIVSHAELNEAFLTGQTREVRVKSVHACNAYTDGLAFIKTLAAEIRRMEKVGPGQVSPEGLAYKGDDLPDMIEHMIRNGLQFTPAKPGDEPAYNQVFQMLRDLYVGLEEDLDAPDNTDKVLLPTTPTRIPLGVPKN